MRRWLLLSLIAVFPVAAGAQQTEIPTVGFLNTASAAGMTSFVVAFRRGLKETGWTEGHNLNVDYRWADDRLDQLPLLAKRLVDGRSRVVFTTGSAAAALALKSVTSTVPIVFALGADPEKLGLVSSFSRPGSNATGVFMLVPTLAAKRFEFLREIVPSAVRFGMLGNPKNPNTKLQFVEAEAAAEKLGVSLKMLEASTVTELPMAFAATVNHQISAIIVTSDPLYTSHRVTITELASKYSLPAIYQWQEFVTSGGLISYGSSLSEAYEQSGQYVGKILNGEKPADLPVIQPRQFYMKINLKTAKSLGLDVPVSLLLRADDVIE